MFINMMGIMTRKDIQIIQDTAGKGKSPSSLLNIVSKSNSPAIDTAVFNKALHGVEYALYGKWQEGR